MAFTTLATARNHKGNSASDRRAAKPQMLRPQIAS